MNHARHVTGNAPADATIEACSCDIDPFVYGKLEYIAVLHLRREPRAYDFDPKELVSEVYLRLAGTGFKFADQGHFFAIASRIMNQILVDNARRQLAAKRGSGSCAAELDETHAAAGRAPELVALSDALDELVKFSKRKARVTVLHYFGGLTQSEIARLCGIHTNTVSSDLRDSKAWLRNRLTT